MSEQGGHHGDPKRKGDHLAEFFGRGEAFARQLIAENERLRQELSGREDGGASAGPVLPATVVEDLIARVSELENQLSRGTPLLVDPRSVRELEERCVGLGDEVKGLRQTIRGLESENYHLATLYIVVQQLHAATSLGDVVQTLTEVCLNFLGIGVFALWLVDEERQVIFPVLREGAAFDDLGERPLADDGPIAAAAALGRAWQGGDPLIDGVGVRMILPLFSGARLLGILSLEDFLTQKTGLSDDDLAVLAMLSEHGGIALAKVWAASHATVTPLSRRAVEAALEG